MQQLAVAFPKQHTQIQDFGNVKEEILIDNFSKHGWGDKVLLRVEEQSFVHGVGDVDCKLSYWCHCPFREHKFSTLDSLCVAILRKVKKTARCTDRCMSATAGEEGTAARSRPRGAWWRYESRHLCRDSSNTTCWNRDHGRKEKDLTSCKNAICCRLLVTGSALDFPFCQHL